MEAYPDIEEVEASVPTSLITGLAGSGKTTLIRNRIDADPKEGVLASTTGISAVNLGTTTINALLKFFDTNSLRDSFVRGKLQRYLAQIAHTYRNIFIDEVSMMDADQLDIIYEAVREVNGRATTKHPLGIVIVGDFLQLPPIKAKWVFEAEHWKGFEDNVTRLTKIYRQENPEFLEAINAIRKGDGGYGASLLKAGGRVQFARANSLDFPGTTILAKNIDVDRYNSIALSKLKGDPFQLRRLSWLHSTVRSEPGEWKLIPQELKLKVGAYVMILANSAPQGDGQFLYANGDCGHIIGYVSASEMEPFSGRVIVKLVRNDNEVMIPMVERTIEALDDPIERESGGVSFTSRVYTKADFAGGVARPWGEVYMDDLRDRFIVGGVRFFPLRLGYAATVHRTQGLSLDRVQMDVRNPFFGSPAMIYVAMSRCRTPEGLQIVGSPEVLAARVKIAPEVMRWA